MTEQNFNAVKTAVLSIVFVGVISLIASTFLFSTFLVIVGFSLIFWGTLLFYVIPSKSNFALLVSTSATVTSENIERIIIMNAAFEKGIYFPADHLYYKNEIFKKTDRVKNEQRIVVFIPKNLQMFHGVGYNDIINKNNKNGIYVTPPGFGLCKILEQKTGRSFSKMSLKNFIAILPNVLTKGSRFAESVDIQLEHDSLTIMVSQSLFLTSCKETDNLPYTHKQVGCLLSSAIACALAKVLDKPVIIESETRDSQAKIMHVKYKFTPQD